MILERSSENRFSRIKQPKFCLSFWDNRPKEEFFFGLSLFKNQERLIVLNKLPAHSHDFSCGLAGKKESLGKICLIT